jgi:hypothetical protein
MELRNKNEKEGRGKYVSMRFVGRVVGREDAYVMKEVRASVCSMSALSASSR